MLEGFKPIDFGTFLSPNKTGQMRNRVGLSQGAMDILANSRWNKAPISSLLAQGLNTKGEAPKREQTLWGRVVDLLSTPAYAIGNAADDALAGHQSSDNDSVLNDAKEIAGGIFSGLGRGAGTGLRGFAGDLVGMDPADPMDKQYLDDFLVRLDTHMSAEEAAKPENLEEVRRRLEMKKINQLVDDDDLTNRYFYNWDTGQVEVTDEKIQEYFKEMGLAGAGASMVADPTNFITAWTKPALLSKGAEIPGQALKQTENIYDGFKALPKSSEFNTLDNLSTPVMGKSGSYKVGLPEANQQIVSATGDSLIKPPEWFNFPKSADEIIPPSVKSIPPITPPAIPPAPKVPLKGKLKPNFTPDMDKVVRLFKNNMPTWMSVTAFSPWVAKTDDEFKILNDFMQKYPGKSPREVIAIPGAEAELRSIMTAHINTPEYQALINPSIRPSVPSAPVEQTVTRTAPVDVNVTDPLDEIINAGSPGEALKGLSQNKPNVNVLPSPRIPDAQIKIAESLSSQPAITKLTGDLLRRASTGEKGWAYSLSNRLKSKYPGVAFPQTDAFIERISKIPDFHKRLGIPTERAKIVDAFGRVLRSDVETMKMPPPISKADEIIRNTNDNPMAMGELVAGAKPKPIIPSKNPTRDLGIVQDVIKQFEPQLSLKEIPSGINNPVRYREAMRKHGALTGPKQANIWNVLTSKHLVNVKRPQRFQKALDLLRIVEDRLIAAGHIPMSSTPKLGGSIPLRLSQIIEAIGPAAAAMSPSLLTKILRGEESALKSLPAEVLQKIEEIKAGEAIVDSSKMVKGVEAGSKAIEDLIKGPLSAGQLEEIVTIGSKVADDITRAAGGSSVAAKMASRNVKSTYIPKVPGDGFSATNTIALISHPNVSSNLLKKYSNAPAITRQIHQNIGGPAPRHLGKMVGEKAKVLEWLGARFNAAYKNADMRPIYLKNAAFAKSTVARRAEYLNGLAKRFNPNDVDLWNDALKGAQGRLEAVPGSQSAELSGEISAIMKNLFGSSGLTTQVFLDNAVTARAQLFMKELNANLKRFGLGKYQFKKSGDYKDGISWLKSWEAWDIDKPLEFLFKIQNVVEHTVREKTMFDEIAARFGTLNRGGEFTHTVKHDRLAGYYFGKEAAEQINQFVKNLKDVSTPSSKQLQYYDKAISKWKAGVTIYVPSHHVRNMIGDLYFNWLSGVNSIKPYNTALRVMQSQKGRYEGLQGIEDLISPEAIKAAMSGATSTPAGKQTALTMKNGQNVTNDMVYISAFQNGILPTTRVLEDIPDDAITALDKIRPFGGRVQKKAHQLSEGRDHYVRLAHFIDALKKSNKPFEQAVEEAAAIVRKWHPDGMDLTGFERNVMRRMFPFYSWSRKAYPLILESLVATPGKVMAYPKGIYMIQQMMGIDTGPMSDPFPVDQLFPDWIREKGIGPIFSPESELPVIGNVADALGGQRGYSVLNPSNPTVDAIAQANNPGKMAIGMLNPAARIPFELATGRESQTGAPIDSNTDYAVKQIPGLSHAGRITGEFGVSDTQKENSNWVNWQNILNMLTAAGAQNTGPYRKSAEFDLRDFLKNQRG